MRSRLLATTLLAATLASVVVGCATRNPDIDRIVDPYWDKDYFSSDDVWYLRSSIVDAPPNTGPWLNVGDGHWLLVERLRWEITENLLIGWRDFETVEGSEEATYDGNGDLYKGSAVVAFRITDHFDAVRQYDPLTQEPGNVISENRWDRPWYDREYFRVDWRANVINLLSNGPTFFFHEISNVAQEVQNNDPGDPDRFRFEDDYMEITTRTMFSPEIFSYFGIFGDASYMFDDTNQIYSQRYSFVKAEENDDYIPLHMPGRVILEDEDGNEVRDENGFAQRVPIWDRFGIYSTLGRRTWVSGRGDSYASGEKYHATRFDIWERSKNADGTIIPMEERTPKPIVYYTNVHHPDQLMNGSVNRVGAQWNEAFKEVVFYAQLQTWDANGDGVHDEDELANVPDMFIVRENDCNDENVAARFDALPPDLKNSVDADAAYDTFERDIADGSMQTVIDTVANRIEWANSYDNTDPFSVRQNLETQAKSDLERVCSSLEFHTKNAARDGRDVEVFDFQRMGDLRYNMMNLVMGEHNAGWLGLGPMLADPVTGKSIAAVANIAVIHLDRAAANADQRVQSLNGLIPFGDLVYGYDIQNYMTEKLAEVDQLTTGGTGPGLNERMARRFDVLDAQGDGILTEISPTFDEARLARARGTEIEQRLIGPEEELLAMVDPVIGPEYAGMNTEELLTARASPVRPGYRQNSWMERESQIHTMGAMMMDPPEYADQFTLGLAIKYRDMPPRERFEQIREDIYTAVQLHEVGHNVGLFHNFEASSDALNFGEFFWSLQDLPEDIDEAITQVTDPDMLPILDRCRAEEARLQDRVPEFSLTTQACLRQTQGAYASIMDYHANWNADFNGLGPYDKAAIKFSYGQLLEVFADDALTGETTTEQEMRDWLFLNDWRDIPNSAEGPVDGIENLYNRRYIKYDWGPYSTRQVPPDNVVPYRFCPGGMRGAGPMCKVFDYGPDTRENGAMNQMRYYQNYFFTHFNRDRLWDWGGNGMWGAFSNDQRVLMDYTEKMKWYAYYTATVPNFAGSYAEEDFRTTTIQGLNHISAMIGHPGSGEYVTVPKYLINYYLDDAPDVDRLGNSDIMLPFADLFQCDAINQANVDGNGFPTSPLAGNYLGNVPLGEGRPFFIGLTEHYEDWFLNYIGSYWAKLDALFFLGYNFSYFPRNNTLTDPRFFTISWYRLFPEEVGRLVHNLATENYAELGPLVDSAGNLHRRDLIDPETGRAPDYSNMGRVFPSISFQHQVQAVLYAHALMSHPWDGDTDLSKSFKIAVEGGDDDFGAFDTADPSLVAEFTHPESGQRLRALKGGEYSSAFRLLERANLLKDRYETLDACVRDPVVMENTPYCHCVNSVAETAQGRQCAAAFYEVPGNGECNFYDLENRRESALESLNDMVDFIDDVRLMNRIFGEW